MMMSMGDAWEQDGKEDGFVVRITCGCRGRWDRDNDDRWKRFRWKLNRWKRSRWKRGIGRCRHIGTGGIW